MEYAIIGGGGGNGEASSSTVCRCSSSEGGFLKIHRKTLFAIDNFLWDGRLYRKRAGDNRNSFLPLEAGIKLYDIHGEEAVKRSDASPSLYL